MAKANLVQKKIRLAHRDIIKFQITTHCFINNISMSTNELDCLVLLAVYEEYELSDFCDRVVDEKIFKTSQTVRNFLTKACKLNMVYKHGNNKKKIEISKDLLLQTKGTIILDYKIFYIATEEQ
jgi:hypothetical protein